MQGVGYEIIVISTNILLYLRNDSYYGRRIGNHTQLSNGTSFNDLEWPLTQISRSRYYSTSNYSKMVQDRAILTVADQQKVVCSIEWFHFQQPWTTPNSDFKVTPLFDAEYLRNGTRSRHSFVVLRLRYSLLNGVFSNDLEWQLKYSRTGSVARSLCDSWASCCTDDTVKEFSVLVTCVCLCNCIFFSEREWLAARVRPCTKGMRLVEFHRYLASSAVASPAMGHWGTCPPWSLCKL